MRETLNKIKSTGSIYEWVKQATIEELYKTGLTMYHYVKEFEVNKFEDIQTKQAANDLVVAITEELEYREGVK